MEIQSRVRGDLELDVFAYHPKIQERLNDWLVREQSKLETCEPHDLPKVQAMVAALKMMVSLPERILQEERHKRNTEQAR
jgi:hypothetical protein